MVRLLQKSEREVGARPKLIPLERQASERNDLPHRVAAGQPAAIAELFDDMAPLVRSLLIRMLGRSDEVDDLVQDVFLVLIRRCRTLEKPEALRSFVIGVSVRLAKKALRLRSMRRWVGLDRLESPPIVPAFDPHRADQVGRVYQLLDRLGPEARVIYTLRHIEGMALNEVAEANGCSLATVKRRLARVERQFESLAKSDPALRELLEEAR